MKEDNSKSKLVCNTFNAKIVIDMFNANNDINFVISKNGKYICNIDVHGLVEVLKIFKSQS
jgi:hypothetical protein